MKEGQKKLVILGIIIAVLLLIFLLMWFYIQYLKMKEEVDSQIAASSVIPETTSTDIFDDNNVKVYREDGNKIYVNFEKDLYEEDGTSNQEYFEKVIDSLNELNPRSDYYLVDEEKEINIHVIAKSNGTYSYEINDLNGYFERVDGEVYSKVKESELKRSYGDSNFAFENGLLFQLTANSPYLSSIEKRLGEGRDLENGYKSYQDGSILVRISPVKAVRNMIFTSLYDGDITGKVKVGTPLEDIKEFYPDNSFGGLSEGYLGYITEDFYYFFYPDEISVYSYLYEKNSRFENILKKYIEDRNLSTFVNRISASFAVYDSLEYDEGMQDADIMLSNRGVEVKIRENNPKGITLYSNYYFTEYTRNLVKEGIVSYSEDDLVDICERERRKSK